MVKIIDLSVKLEDFMPSHKNLQRPFVKPHVTHEYSKSRKLSPPRWCNRWSCRRASTRSGSGSSSS
jgi:hypothetical protein